jgi:hypothetical protein
MANGPPRRGDRSEVPRERSELPPRQRGRDDDYDQSFPRRKTEEPRHEVFRRAPAIAMTTSRSWSPAANEVGVVNAELRRVFPEGDDLPRGGAMRSHLIDESDEDGPIGLSRGLA